ncbi:ABC transporter permease [Iodobacter sp. HSC-16F04]|uniref:ABC transporter permease n=1 Tax=Iodobacter violaceini TaxID=3044271 RepID=A0ABX0KV31_9NEIS|nr:ABC transporter permease [Iodobacter violacea]NHQ88580.1 ABC transporter permease [Iodobacter violacea]
MLTSWFRPFTHAAMHRVLLRQLYFSGVQSIGVSALAGAAMGAIVITLVQGNFGQSGARAMNVLMISCMQEVGPLMVALIFTARSASAITTELVAMKVAGELRTLLRLGISVGYYLIWPRIVAAALSCVLLFCYFMVAALFCGALTTPQSGLIAEIDSSLSLLSASSLLMGLAKSALFGFVTSASACYLGLSAGFASTEIPRLASRAVLVSIVAMLLLDALIAVLVSHLA